MVELVEETEQDKLDADDAVEKAERLLYVNISSTLQAFVVVVVVVVVTPLFTPDIL